MSTVNTSVITVAKAIKRCSVVYPWPGIAFLYRPLQFLAMRQGEQVREAYPETYKQLIELFGENEILLAQLEAFVIEDIPRDRRLVIEEMYRQVAPIIDIYMETSSILEAPDYVRCLAASLTALDIMRDAILRGAVADDDNHVTLWYAVQRKYFEDPLFLEE
jgi:hypothetical protein